MSFQITFGLKDKTPADWSGNVNAAKGQMITVEGHHFRAEDAASTAMKGFLASNNNVFFPFDYMRNQNRWVCCTRYAPNGLGADEWVNRKDEIAKPTIQSPSILLHVFKKTTRPIRIETVSGTFEFMPETIRPFESESFLDNNVRVTCIPSATAVSENMKVQQDFPSILSSKSGDIWMAWQEFDGHNDSICVRRQVKGHWLSTDTILQAADTFHTALSEDSKGRIWITWSMQANQNWDLYGSYYDGQKWSAPQRLTKDAGPDVYHKSIIDSQGRMWLVWQQTNGLFSQIIAMYYDGDKWSSRYHISDGVCSTSNNWWPVLAAGENGDLAIAWDGYAAGHYDIYLRYYKNGQWDQIQTISNTPQFQAHPTIAFDNNNRLWIAWDQSGCQWGKDTGFVVKDKGTGLHQSRSIHIAVLDKQQKRIPTDSLKRVLHPGIQGQFWELPHLQSDSDGNIWLFVRRFIKQAPNTPDYTPCYCGLWEMYVTTYDGKQWSELMPLPHSAGRNDMIPATVNSSGRLWATWVTDNRSTRSWKPFYWQVYASPLPQLKSAYTPLQLKPLVSEQVEDKIIEPNEAAQVARIRNYKINHNGKTYFIYRGDLHRHTDISHDGFQDGSLLDLYRYARDAGALDFVCNTDHTFNMIAPYEKWRSHKMADIFQLQNFVSFYGYERSLPYPNGDRNVFMIKRNVPVKPKFGSELSGWAGAVELYHYLHQYNGFTIAHTSGRWSGTDWRDNDPFVEPVVEIYQGKRDTYEYVGAPRPKRLWETFPDPNKPIPRASNVEGIPSFREKGFVRNALDLGHKLGFIASSDHISTHISYACILAEELTLTDLLSGIRARRTYAATDNIILDIRFIGSDSEHFFGEEFISDSPVKCKCTIIGTAPILQIDIIKDNDIIHTLKPKKSHLQFEFADEKVYKGQSYYYIRVIQEDGDMAWSSPAWVTYQ